MSSSWRLDELIIGMVLWGAGAVLKGARMVEAIEDCCAHGSYPCGTYRIAPGFVLTLFLEG
ncbi:hypothetical protein [Nocardia brasiliensis]|uniref:hypothetical protein n=1 Tax=Nocardia brasiliensis TaxID=37326 RepID=UPI002456B5B8|nr:hypothetical protein [Nocardia brasiliensis]